MRFHLHLYPHHFQIFTFSSTQVKESSTQISSKIKDVFLKECNQGLI